VECLAVPQRQWSGNVVFVGRTQSKETRAVPVVVQVDNSDGRLRPGMFARVALPDGEPREVPCVPVAAVGEDQGQRFVFVEREHGAYERVDVHVGLTADGFTELVRGPPAGTHVVSRGVFFLKSELLLEPEE
jgi:cobalt-zinc-cadmium efflux system membrane fusion protein